MKKINAIIAIALVSGLGMMNAEADVNSISFYVYNAVNINLTSVKAPRADTNEIRVDFYTSQHTPNTDPCYSMTVSPNSMSGRIRVPDSKSCIGNNTQIVISLTDPLAKQLFKNNGSITFDSSKVLPPKTSDILNVSVMTQPTGPNTGVLQVTDAPGLPQ